MSYVVVFEKTETGYSAYAPDLPGLGVAGDTRAEVEQLIREGVEVYLEEISLRGMSIPQATTTVGTVEPRNDFAKAS